MSENVFDRHSSDYNKVLADSLGLSSEDKCSFFDSYKSELIGKQFDPLLPYRILDFGCGIGKLSIHLAGLFANSHVLGHDLSPKALDFARERHAEVPNLSFVDSLPDDQSFNIIVASNVFHHIEKAERNDVLHSLFDRLKNGGSLVIIEHNPFNPLTRHIVNRCPLDVDAELISRQEFIDLARLCGFEVDVKKYVMMFPWDIKPLRKIESWFEQIPLGAQYMLVLTRND